jgi:hypothetical protein
MIARITVAVGGGVAKGARGKRHRVDDPELADAEGGVERRLAPHVVSQRRIGDLDDQQDVRSRQALEAGRARIDHDVRLEISVLAEPEGRLGSQVDTLRRNPKPAPQQRCRDDLVMISLRRHRNELPPDQLHALVLVHDAGRNHRLHLGHREPAARKVDAGAVFEPTLSAKTAMLRPERRGKQ